MGTKGRQIVGMDINELLDMLNKAFADGSRRKNYYVAESQ